jgi:4-diphosphocytidyl-2-C-methyl-D-erythritol kinase
MKELAHAKVNIFLKIVGKRDSYHEIISRFMKVSDLYDEIEFVKKDTISDEFELVGEFGCRLEQNTIYKAYKLLDDKRVIDFFKEYKVVVTKNIPEFAGLGGGSSDAATFLRATNRLLNLDIDLDTLASLGAKIGADVPFFIYNYNSANVRGIGEIVEEFDEELLAFKTLTPHIKCDTAKVYGKFRDDYFNFIDPVFANKLSTLKSSDILKNYSPTKLNDLLSPSLDLYPNLVGYDGFFSGSGSTFFNEVNDG